jgi:hypothetical protein
MRQRQLVSVETKRLEVSKMGLCASGMSYHGGEGCGKIGDV